MNDQPKPTTRTNCPSCGQLIPLQSELAQQADAWTDLRTKVFEALGEASMQWEPRPSGVFDSSGCERIGNDLWQAINAALAAEREKKVTDIESVMDECQQLRDQLADEKSSCKNAHDAYALVSLKNAELHRQLAAAQAAMKEGK